MAIIILWGTVFSSNRGVNALARATCEILQRICPDERIILIGSGKKEPTSFNNITFYPMPNIIEQVVLFLKVNSIGKKPYQIISTIRDFLMFH